MKILIADKFQKNYLGDLQKLGHEITLNPDLKAEDLPNEIAGYEALIVRSTKVNATTIEVSDNLSLIIRAGAGVNTIDVDAAAKKGIFVCNTPGKNSIAVAELAFGLMLSIDRKIPDCVIELKNSQWNKKKYSKADGILGKTVGIIGLGDIGQAFALRAHAFGMKILAYDPIALQNMPPKVADMVENRIVKFCDKVEDLVKDADVITIHVPSNPHTQGMVNKEFLKNIKENAVLINTSRGNIVNDEALLEAIKEKNIRLGLDVYNNECATATGSFETELSKNPNVYGTHHIGASTEQAQNAIAAEVVEILDKFEQGIVLHPVDIEMKPATKFTLIVRIFDRVGVIASICLLLKEQGVNIQQMEGRVFAGENAQQIIFHLSKCIDKETIEKLSKLENVIQVSVKGCSID
ncbi:MAG: NAD(P)-binding domain-containing protein [bacterium]|nr:NAD(P)-binding domain-containing protein [bacterium]